MNRRIIFVPSALVLTLAVLAVTPDAALAQEETIDACVHHGSGVLYLPADRESAGEQCAYEDEALSWSAQASSALQVTIVTSATTSTVVLGGSRSTLAATARCPAGAMVLGGGGSLGNSGLRPGPALVDSKPVSGPDGWTVHYRLDHSDGTFGRQVEANAYAVCAVTPS